jgi:hypothetical protein
MGEHIREIQRMAFDRREGKTAAMEATAVLKDRKAVPSADAEGLKTIHTKQQAWRVLPCKNLRTILDRQSIVSPIKGL